MSASGFSTKTIKTGMRLQQLGKNRITTPAYRAGRWVWAGSSSPSHVWVDWLPVRELHGIGSDAAPVEGAGNPEAHLPPRTYNRALVIGAGMSAMNALQKGGETGQPAIGYQHRGQVYAGVLPEGFGHIPIEGTEEMLVAAALREGRVPALGMIGLWFPEREQLRIPEQHLVADLVPVADMSTRYPGVPMV